MNKQPNSRMCFACGLQNPAGLQGAFYTLEDGTVMGKFTAREEHQGYPGIVHGGVITAMLDEVIARAGMGDGETWGVTVSIEVRFRHKVPVGEPLTIIGQLTHQTSRLYEGKGELQLGDGTLAAEATARYYKISLGDIPDIDVEQLFWQVVPDP